MTSPTDRTAHAEIRDVLDRRVAACDAKDIDRLMALYADDIVYYDVIPPQQFVGADAVRRNFLRWSDEYVGPMTLETQDEQVAVSGDVAFAHMIHADIGTRRNGEYVTVFVRSTVCLQRVGGRWLITHEHISFPINPQNWTAVVGAPEA